MIWLNVLSKKDVFVWKLSGNPLGKGGNLYVPAETKVVAILMTLNIKIRGVNHAS